MSDPEAELGEEALWATTTDGALLEQLFGYRPTLHDAIIQTVTYEGGVLELTVIYSDLPEAGERELRVRFSLVFSGSVEAELDMDSPDVCNFALSQSKGRVQADFLYCSGEYGKVRADRLDVRLASVDPLADREPRRLRIC
jgi:hypothetical protein